MSWHKHPGPPLDPTIYNLGDGEIAFFKEQTGIQDDSRLRDHILQIQAEAYAIYPYPCIRIFSFAKFKISRHPDYRAALDLGKARQDAILLDLGCCLGVDLRKAVADGFPGDRAIASDLHPEFWMLGHKLFKTTRETFPAQFIAGDIFDSEFLSPTASPLSVSSDPPLLSSLASLTPLQNRVSVIYTAALFHLFSEEKQQNMAYLLSNLLSPAPGSMIFGMHMGAADTEETKNGGTWANGRNACAFAHSATSWKNMWAGECGVFKAHDVVVKAGTREILQKGYGWDDSPCMSYLLYWSVTRV